MMKEFRIYRLIRLSSTCGITWRHSYRPKCKYSTGTSTIQHGNAVMHMLSNLKRQDAIVLANRVTKSMTKYKTYVQSQFDDALVKARSQHPRHVIVVLNDEGYIAYGVDAVICVEYGIMPPKDNMTHVVISQERLEQLMKSLEKDSIHIAIYKTITTLEWPSDNDHYMVLKKSLIYSHEASAAETNTPIAKPNHTPHKNFSAVGITHNKTGYSISIIDPVNRTLFIRDHLTTTGAMTLLQNTEHTVVIFQQGNVSVKNLLMQIPTIQRCEQIQVHGSTEAFHETVCRNIKIRLGINSKFKVKRMVVSCEMPNPLNKLTALALGLDQRDCSKESPKGLDRYMLPDNSQRYMKTYMLYMLSHLSDPNIAANVKYVVEKLATTQVSILYEAPITPNKIKCIVSQYKIDTVIMTELQHTLDAYLYYSRSLPNTIKKKIHVIAASDLNLASNIDKLTEDVEICQQVIRNVMHNNRIIPSTGIHALDELFQKEESTFNGMHPSYIVKELYQVDIAACQLIQAVATYFITVPEMAAIDITQPSKWRSYIATELQTHIANTESSNIVINDNYVIFKKITNVEHHKNLRSTEAVIDNQLITGYINNEVTQAMLNYRNRCSIAKYKAQQALSQRARILAKYAQNLVLASHCVVVVQTLAAHVSMATAKGWSHPNISPDRTIIYKNLIPHMDDQDEAIPLTVSLSGVNIIRGSNNSGKSTILSAILAATVAAQSGLYVPCSKGSNIPIYSNIMYHSFTRNKLPVDMSSVEYNVKSLTEILDSADEKSLVIIDELGSNMCDAYAKAVLSYVVDSLEQKKCTAIIATNTNADYITNPGCHHYKIVLEKNTITLVTNDSDRICFSFEFQNSKLLQQLVPLAQKTNDSTNTTLQVTLPDDLPMELHPAAELVLSSLGNMRICTNPKEIVHIYPNGMPPPMLNNAPVLYIMLIPLKESTNTCGNTTVHEPQEKVAIYVGESGNLELRLKAHRSKPVITLEKYMAMNFMNHDISTTTYMRNTMGCETQNSQYLCWAEAHTIVLKLTSRKDAKIAERRLIKRLYMKQSEVVLLSQRDGIYRELPCVD